MKTSTIILLAVIGGLLLFGGCGAVNFQRNAVTAEENIKGKWANVESEYQRRSDLIPNLVNTVKGEANFEQTTLQNVINARASATQIKIDPTNLTPEKIAEYQAAQGQLSQALGRLLMVTENYPNLRANDAFRNLQTQLEGTENRIKVARNDFNAATQGFNTLIRRFPNNLYSGFMGFKEMGYFKAEAGSEKAPEVKF
ncbi:LemA family protein [Lacibacter sp. MH-610]|uniref:LemA family protein n=1 Tax=Lacibacter sp. MH-610 TaxID=3020883 RepID=UPI002E5320DE|nr:LemA family protein [Lacibacter sp.]